MQNIRVRSRFDYLFLAAVAILLLLSILVLKSIASAIFPWYFIYIVIGLLAYVVARGIDFDILSLFSWHFYIFSVIFLTIPLIVGHVTRGTIRWIPIGALSIQPSEIVKPFLLIFFANYLTAGELTIGKFAKAVALLLLPLALIFVQPSLGVAALLAVSFLGVLLAANIKKRYIFLAIVAFLAAIPVIWLILAPYQRDRVTTFIRPSADPYGAGYNALQATISVGSGEIFGRGLGKGVGTQLAFLPEKQTDFIFAAIAEELGLIGAVLVLAVTFFLLLRLVLIIDNARSMAARAYISGLFLMLFVQIIIHVGMNMGMFPITGVPYPLVSAGGSSLVGTLIGLSIAQGAKKG
jgi:rod shape determining protein RodA